MTRKEAMKEVVELQLTFPIPPRDGAEAVRADETERRIHALWGYVFCDEPAPPDGWKPSVPGPTGEERERHILHWAQVQIAEFEAADAALRKAEAGRSDQGPRPNGANLSSNCLPPTGQNIPAQGSALGSE